jgi:AraC family transcriptional regulator
VNTSNTPKTETGERGRRLTVGSWRVELLPRRPYKASFVPDRSVIGFAFESQSGTHAFASDRVRPFLAKPNSLAYLPSGCDVFSLSPDGGEYLRVIDETGANMNDMTQRQFSDAIDPVAISAAQSIRSLLLANAAAPLLIEEKAIILVERVRHALKGSLAEPAEGRWMTSARLRCINELIDSTIGQEVTIRDMAATLGLSEGFFTRAFKAAVGKSPHSYLIDRRIARARVLLRTCPHDLSDIALAVGFSSHAHMSAAFRKRLGVTPSHLREAIHSGATHARRGSY